MINYEDLSNLDTKTLINLLETNCINLFTAQGDRYDKFRYQRNKCYEELLKRV